jgi:hypothetical protein
MSLIIDQIELQTHDKALTLRFTSLERFADGSGYRCTLFVRSRGFACERPFYFDDSTFPAAIKALESMDSGRAGEALIKGEWDDDFIKFTSNALGHVFVSGALFEHSEMAQSLQFEFRTDQTVLRPLIREFRPLLGV